MVVIPARAGSKRVIDKNNQKIGDMTLVEWAIEYALTTFPRNKIVLVTDSEESKSSGKRYGISVLDRPTEISGDYSSTESVVEYVYNKFPCENYVLLQPTSPFRKKSDLELCLQNFEELNVNSVMSMAKPWNSLKDLYIAENETEFTFQPKSISNETSADNCYFDTGAIYVFSMEILNKDKVIVDPNHSYGVKVNQMSFFDIDYPFQLSLANAYYQIFGWSWN